MFFIFHPVILKHNVVLRLVFYNHGLRIGAIILQVVRNIFETFSKVSLGFATPKLQRIDRDQAWFLYGFKWWALSILFVYLSRVCWKHVREHLSRNTLPSGRTLKIAIFGDNFDGK